MKPTDLFSTKTYPVGATVRVCLVCGHTETVRSSGGLERRGRGYGFRIGNQARGRMIQHIKSAHADKLKEV